MTSGSRGRAHVIALVVVTLVPLLAYELIAVAVAPHPESDWASIRVQLSSA